MVTEEASPLWTRLVVSVFRVEVAQFLPGINRILTRLGGHENPCPMTCMIGTISCPILTLLRETNEPRLRA